jgi:hypothetical protein
MSFEEFEFQMQENSAVFFLGLFQMKTTTKLHNFLIYTTSGFGISPSEVVWKIQILNFINQI